MHKILVRKPEGKISLGTSVHRGEYNIKTVLKKISYDGVEWIHLARDRVQWRVLVNSNEVSGFIQDRNFLIYCKLLEEDPATWSSVCNMEFSLGTAN